MAKIEIKADSRANQVFDDLEKYLDFCRDFGYKYDESDLYNNKSHVYRQYTKFLSGKEVKDMWGLDLKED